MAEDNNIPQLKLKVDPKSLHSKKEETPKTAPVPVMENHSETVALKKNRVATITQTVVSVPENKPESAVAVVEEPAKQLLKNKKSRNISPAEREYRRHVALSFLIVALVIFGLLVIISGIVSTCLLTAIIENPAHAYTLKDASIRCEQTNSLGEKIEIMSSAFSMITSGNSESEHKSSKKTSTYTNSYSDGSRSPGTFGKIKNRAKTTARSAQGRDRGEE